MSAEEYSEIGHSCLNGYCHSLNVPSLKLQDGKNQVVSLIKISPGLKDWLKSDNCLQLTRQTLSAFELFQTCSSLTESRESGKL
eukprot:816629-Amphidinium_carterae.1